MTKIITRPNVTEYIDYRRYLKDVYHASKQNKRESLSFRAFSLRAGFSSPNYLKLVMDGQRNLSLEGAQKFANALGLNKTEREYFTTLVLMNQADSSEEKEIAYRKLLQIARFKKTKQLEKNQFEYCAEWYHSVIRELVTNPQFDGTAQWLANRISPQITLSQAERSLELLVKLGFLKKENGANYVQSAPVVTTGAEVVSLALYRYHMELLDLARRSLEHVPAEKRDMSSMTLGVSAKKIPLIKKRIQEFRQEILQMVSDDKQAEEVCQLCLYFFPMSRENIQ